MGAPVEFTTARRRKLRRVIYRAMKRKGQAAGACGVHRHALRNLSSLRKWRDSLTRSEKNQAQRDARIAQIDRDGLSAAAANPSRYVH